MSSVSEGYVAILAMRAAVLDFVELGRVRFGHDETEFGDDVAAELLADMLPVICRPSTHNGALVIHVQAADNDDFDPEFGGGVLTGRSEDEIGLLMGRREVLVTSAGAFRSVWSRFRMGATDLFLSGRCPTAGEKASGINWVITIGGGDRRKLDFAISYSAEDDAVSEIARSIRNWVRRTDDDPETSGGMAEFE